jgi:hypothetical protein
MKTYEKQTDAVLTGGLNLLPPGDLISPVHSLELDNFRPWGQGAIRSRLGRGVDLTSLAGSPITSILKSQTIDATWAVGAGGTLHFIGGGSNVTGFGTAQPISMIAMNGFIWATTRTKQSKHDGSDGLRWVPAAPGTITNTPQTGGGPLTIGATFVYYVTYVTDAGHESQGTSVTWVPSGTEQIAKLHIPTTTDAQVTGANVYRQGLTLAVPYRLNPTPLATGIDFQDGGGDDMAGNFSDASLLALDLQYETDHQDPPAARGIAGPYFGKMLMWSSSDHPNRLWWSKTDTPYFPGSGFDTGNWVDVGEEGEDIIDVSIWPRMAIIYKANSVHRIVGDPDDIDSDVECISSGISLAAFKARARAGNLDYILAGEGIYSWNGDAATKVSPTLDPLFKGESADTSNTLSGMDLSRSSCCMAHRNGRLYFSYPEATHPDVNTRTLVLEIATGRWVSDSRAFSALYDEGPSGSLLAANTELFDLEDGYTDNGTGIALAWHSGFRHQGAPENEKTYADLNLEIDTQGQAMTVTLLYNNNTSNESLGTVTSTGRTPFTLNVGSADLGTKARNVAVRITGTAGSLPVTIYSVTLHYYLNPRQTKTVDTDFSDWGTASAKEIDVVEVDYDFPEPAGNDPDNPFTLALSVFCDSTTATYTHTLPITTRRKKLELFITPNIVGRLVRVTITSDHNFQAWGARVRYRPLGVYLLGASQEYWTTQPVGIGI